MGGESTACVSHSVSLKVNVSMVVAKLMKNSAVKLKSGFVANLVRWVVLLGSDQYIDEANAWHSSNVDPCKLTLPQSFYQASFDSLPPKVPLFAVTLYEVAHDETGKVEKQFPLPDVCNFITAGDMKALSAKADTIRLCEKAMAETRARYSQKLEDMNPGVTALTMLRPLEHNMVRSVMSKPCGTFDGNFKLPYPDNFPREQMHTFCEGKFKVMRTGWLNYLEAMYPGIQIGGALRELGLDVFDTKSADGQMEAIV